MEVLLKEKVPENITYTREAGIYNIEKIKYRKSKILFLEYLRDIIEKIQKYCFYLMAPIQLWLIMLEVGIQKR